MKKQLLIAGFIIAGFITRNTDTFIPAGPKLTLFASIAGKTIYDWINLCKNSDGYDKAADLIQNTSSNQDQRAANVNTSNHLHTNTAQKQSIFFDNTVKSTAVLAIGLGAYLSHKPTNKGAIFAIILSSLAYGAVKLTNLVYNEIASSTPDHVNKELITLLTTPSLALVGIAAFCTGGCIGGLFKKLIHHSF